MTTNRGASPSARPEPCEICGVRHRTKTLEQCADEHVSEATLQKSVIGRAKRRGWKVAHVGKGTVAKDEHGNPIIITPMSPGWPDLTLARTGSRLLFMELKKEKGAVTDDQWDWLNLLNECGARAIRCTPQPC